MGRRRPVVDDVRVAPYARPRTDPGLAREAVALGLAPHTVRQRSGILARDDPGRQVAAGGGGGGRGEEGALRRNEVLGYESSACELGHTARPGARPGAQPPLPRCLRFGRQLDPAVREAVRHHEERRPGRHAEAEAAERRARRSRVAYHSVHHVSGDDQRRAADVSPPGPPVVPAGCLGEDEQPRDGQGEARQHEEDPRQHRRSMTPLPHLRQMGAEEAEHQGDEQKPDAGMRQHHALEELGQGDLAAGEKAPAQRVAQPVEKKVGRIGQHEEREGQSHGQQHPEPARQQGREDAPRLGARFVAHGRKRTGNVGTVSRFDLIGTRAPGRSSPTRSHSPFRRGRLPAAIPPRQAAGRHSATGTGRRPTGRESPGCPPIIRVLDRAAGSRTNPSEERRLLA